MPATFKIERQLWTNGFRFVAGVDEVGRGPLAGPIVAAAVIFPQGVKISGLDDSKKLSPQRRAELYIWIKAKALAVSVALINHTTIDRINVGKANIKVLELAIGELKIAPDFVLVDGARNKLNISHPQKAINKGDGKYASVAAASIIAKVTRDSLMVEYDRQYPEYGFSRHKGYGTREHLKNISKFGPCEIHRRSFL
ncbi:MAG: ribonuclease HII [bacterium]